MLGNLTGKPVESHGTERDLAWVVTFVMFRMYCVSQEKTFILDFGQTRLEKLSSIEFHSFFVEKIMRHGNETYDDRLCRHEVSQDMREALQARAGSPRHHQYYSYYGVLCTTCRSRRQSQKA